MSCFATGLVNSEAMADKLDPHHLVALMSYVFRGKQDGSSRFLDPTSINSVYGITNRKEVHRFPILDAIASICVFKEGSQAVAVALRLNPKKQEIRLTIAGNQEVEPCVVDHLKSVWEKLQALSNAFAARRWSGKNEEGSPDISEDIAVGIFREIYEFSMEKQMIRERKWVSGLASFMQLLAKRRGVDLQGFESDLLDLLVGLVSALELVDKLRDYPVRGLTYDEWKMVYYFSMLVNEKARLVLADRKNIGCETLAQELNGKLNLF